MDIKTVGVLGCGLMGSGIAQVCAASGYRTIVLEVEQSFLDKGLGRTKKFLNVVGSLNLASAAALVGVNAALAQANFRRPPARRLLRRRY